MQRIGWIAFVLVVATLATTAAAHAQKRVALVIGNGAYTKVPRLDNPKNDAAAMEVMFKAAGFNAVTRANDLGVVAMRRALRDFSDTAHDADIAVVFYAGHGIEVGDINYLIPVDAVLERDIDARDEAISLDRVNEVLEPVKQLRLVILDACRDNPFARSMRRTIATRSVRSGYGEIDERSLTPNTLVAYAQRAGLTAEDGVGSGNSPYTTALLKHLPTPGLDVELALRRVRDEVLRATKNRQEPFKYGSLGGSEIVLVAAKTVETAKQVETGAAKQLSEAAEAWAVMEKTNSIAALEAYAARFKDTFYGELAKVRIEKLKKQQTAAVSPKPLPKPSNEIAPSKPVPDAGQSAWVKICERTNASDPRSVNVCLTHHERLDGNTGTVVVSVAVRRVEGIAAEHLVVMVPLGVQQEPGMRVSIFPKDLWAAVQKNEKVDESRVRVLKLTYSMCQAGGCKAETPVTPDLIAELKNAGGLVVFAINNAGSPVGVPVTLAGFEQAYAGAPVDNKAYAEARKRLLDQIAARQAEIAKEQAKQKK